MSHKIALPPISPFPKAAAGTVNTVIVDGSSTSQIEDGSWAHPYKTIQAALTACPAPPAADAALHWNVLVVPGVYPEDLVLPAKAHCYLAVLGTGIVIVGIPGGVTRDISWTPVEWAGPPVRNPSASVTGFWVTGDVVLNSANTNSTETLTLRNVICDGAISTGAVAVQDEFLLDLDECTVTGAVTADLLLRANRTVFGAAVTCYKALTLTDCTMTGKLTISTGGSALISKTTFSSDIEVTGAFTGMDGCHVQGSLLGAPGYLRDTTVQGPSVLGTVSKITNCTFDNTLSFTGTSPDVYGSTFTGLVNAANAFGEAHGSSFPGGITLAHVPGGFFGCTLGGNFTGPAGSYLVDGVTAGLSSVTLGGGATLAYLDSATTLHTLVIPWTSGNLAALATEDYDMPLAGSQVLIVAAYVRRNAGTSTSVAVTIYSDIGRTNYLGSVLGTDLSGDTIGGSWVLGPKGGGNSKTALPYWEETGDSSLHLRVKNWDGANAGTFDVVIVYARTPATLPA